jgi:WD40 repeat protein
MRADVARNLQFDPFQPNNFAVIYENGGVAVWDARKDDTPFLKVAAHTTCGLSLAWHPYKPNHLATGSRDKTCKVWNFSPSSEENSISKPIFSLYTPSAIAFIAWRPSHKHHNQIATTSVETGDISIWDIEIPNVPACILRGHKEAVTGFAWLDTPLGGSLSLTNDASTNIDNPSNQKSKQIIPSIVPFTNDIKEHERHDSIDLQFLNIHQHILSVSKDGHAHIQDLRSGYFPRQHIASSLTAISSKGHVAYQRGLISREDPLGLSTYPQYSDLGIFIDRPASFGMKFSNEINNISDNKYNKIVNNVNKDELNDKKMIAVNKIETNISEIKHTPDCSSRIFVGLANFSNLSQAKEVRKFRSAEGNIFDMAMINLLARSYRLGREIEHDSIKRDYIDKLRLVHQAMSHNLNTALDAGLKCRAAVWESVRFSLIFSFFYSLFN